MSAWEGSGFQEASEQERARRERELQRARENAPAYLRNELRQRPASYDGFFPGGVEVQLRAIASEEGYSLDIHDTATKGWISVSCVPVEKIPCKWCGKSYDEHREPTLGGPVARMPCLGLKSGYVPRSG